MNKKSVTPKRGSMTTASITGAALLSQVLMATAPAQTTTPVESRKTWIDSSTAKLQELRALSNRLPATRARNVILFIGDGMGVSTVTAARILEGQEIKKSAFGEENLLSFEQFPNVALSRTYSANQQVSDSAPTMTAMITGVKTNEGVLSIDQSAVKNDHTSYQPDPTKPGYNRLTTLLEMAESAGLATGVVSTARITHATPAACYAHSPSRDWENDADVKSLSPAAFTAGFPDIAKQLIDFSVPGNSTGIEVILGGGSDKFLLADIKLTGATTTLGSDKVTVSSTSKLTAGLTVSGTGIATGTTIKSVDSATQLTLSAAATVTNSADLTFGNIGSANRPDSGKTSGGRRADEDLVAKWKTKNTKRAAYVTGLSSLAAVNPASTDKVFGLFNKSHMEYEVDRVLNMDGTPKTPVEPSLADMTKKAIEVLNKSRKGYFLHVEAGRIDHGHHAGNAYRALKDTIAFSDAIRAAMEMCGPDTLIVVSADHSHVFTMAGYPVRGNDIMGIVKDETGAISLDLLGLPYTTLGYANGPGYTGKSYSKSDKSVVAQQAGAKAFPHSPAAYDNGATRPDLLAGGKDLTESMNFQQEATVPLSSETHAGEDVGIYAKGPNAHLFRGSLEQSMIFWIMADALKLKAAN
jgi:alkaline phosphatase